MSVTRPVAFVTGGRGQVGYELVRELAPAWTVVAPTRAELDCADAEAVRRRVLELRPALVVNAAAYTAVDRAEEEPEACRRLNEELPAAMSEAARRLGAPLVHFSTDYVFDGSGEGRYAEADATNPISVYGRTKRDGDEAVRRSGAPHVIFRVSWVYGTRGRNFLQTILRLAAEREELRIVSDQVGSPTWSRMIAAAVASVVARYGASPSALREFATTHAGVYNLASPDHTTWHGFAEEILRLLPPPGGRSVRLHPIPTAEYPTPARRPTNSRLSIDKSRDILGVELPSWRQQLALAVEG